MEALTVKRLELMWNVPNFKEIKEKERANSGWLCMCIPLELHSLGQSLQGQEDGEGWHRTFLTYMKLFPECSGVTW